MKKYPLLTAYRHLQVFLQVLASSKFPSDASAKSPPGCMASPVCVYTKSSGRHQLPLKPCRPDFLLAPTPAAALFKDDPLIYGRSSL